MTNSENGCLIGLSESADSTLVWRTKLTGCSTPPNVKIANRKIAKSQFFIYSSAIREVGPRILSCEMRSGSPELSDAAPDIGYDPDAAPDIGYVFG